MHIVLANLPWRSRGSLGVRAGSRWPFTSKPEKDGKIHYIPFPFFLAYATALLKREEKDATLIDAIAQDSDEQSCLTQIKSHTPGLIVAETSTPSFDNDIRILKKAREIMPQCAIVLCGPHASVFAKEILASHNFIDYVLIGEYEYTLLDLVNCIEHGLDLQQVAGLAYRKDSLVMVNEPRPLLDRLDDLPWPERENLPLYSYNDGFAGLPQPNVQVWSSRGCPFECSFCLWPQVMYKGHSYRKRNHVDVVDEIESLLKNFSFAAVYFDDDTFNIDRNHVLALCAELRRRKIRIPWAAMARADLMDELLLQEMFDSGLYALKYGIESADQGIINNCKKNADLKKMCDTIKSTQKLGIKVHLTFCLGLPGETKETLQKNIDFIQDIQPDSFQFSLATPFPGTELYRQVEQRGQLFSSDWSDYDGNKQCGINSEVLRYEDLQRVKSDFSVR